MNTKIQISGKELVVEPVGLDKIWSFRRELRIPLDHVAGATDDPGASEQPKGLRGPGLGLPTKWAGTFRKDGEKHFWNASHAVNTVVISLQDEDYDRLFVSVETPRQIVDAINSAISGTLA